MTLDNISEPSIDTAMDYTNSTRANTSQELPKQKKSTAAQIYKLQKQIEDTVARYRTIAYLTSDITALEEALHHCEAAINTLIGSATTTVAPGPPIFTAIEKAGVAEFKKETKSQHRVGVKHKKMAKKGAAKQNVKVKEEPLLRATNTSIGRPKLKRQHRKYLPFPRQTASTDKMRVMKAAQLLQKG